MIGQGYQPQGPRIDPRNVFAPGQPGSAVQPPTSSIDSDVRAVIAIAEACLREQHEPETIAEHLARAVEYFNLGNVYLSIALHMGAEDFDTLSDDLEDGRQLRARVEAIARALRQEQRS